MSLQIREAELQLKKLQDASHESKSEFSNSISSHEVCHLLEEMNSHLKEMNQILQKMTDQDAVQRSIRKAISSEMVKREQQITEESQAMINQTAKTAVKSLEAVSQCTRKQIERLARVTFSDHLFRILKLVILLLAVFILGFLASHIIASWF